MLPGGDEHRHYEDLAVSHVLGGLDEADSRLFRTHLLECPDCRARVGELRALAHELADVERDERRARAAQALGTKRRDDDGDGGDGGDRGGEAPVTTRRRPLGQRLLVVGAVLLLLSLSLWNFTLRGTVARLQDNLDHHGEAAALLEFGVPGLVLTEQDGVQGQVRARGDRMALLLDGLDDRLVYGVYLQDATGRVRFRVHQQARGGRVLSLMDLPAEAHTLLVTDGGLGAEPSGATVLHVRLPEERG